MQNDLGFPFPPHSSGARIPYDMPPKDEWNGLVLVGEAPGAEEVRLGRPFVGRSGQLLNNLLSSLEIDRKACLVANVFRIQPPGNKVDHFFISSRAAQTQHIEIAKKFGKFGSTWCRNEFAGEIENLAEMLKIWQPRSVIALGRTPFWALTGENGLLNHVGKVFECRLMPETKVIPTYHPSFILRGNWGLQDKWREHFHTAQQHLGEKKP